MEYDFNAALDARARKQEDEAMRRAYGEASGGMYSGDSAMARNLPAPNDPSAPMPATTQIDPAASPSQSMGMSALSGLASGSQGGAGSAVGGGIGAAVGSLFPGPGTMIGASIGSGVGGMAEGLIGGEEKSRGEKYAEKQAKYEAKKKRIEALEADANYRGDAYASMARAILTPFVGLLS